MNWRVASKIFPTLIVVCVALVRNASPAQQAHAHWSYEGQEGPEYWSQLDPSYAICGSGHAQSPIDITHVRTAELPPLEFDYRSVPLNIINNGHTIQVNYAPGSNMSVGGKTYTLKQFHFHHPSEEHVHGHGFDLVAHLVHDDGSGHLVVVAVLFKLGSSNLLLNDVWKSIPNQTGQAVDVPSVRLNAKDLLPVDRGYYTFVSAT